MQACLFSHLACIPIEVDIDYQSFPGLKFKFVILGIIISFHFSSLKYIEYHNSMASLLTRLPTEVIENVVSPLDQKSLSSVRLTCRELNLKTLHYFGRTYFTAVPTDFSDKSLQKLQSISENEQFKNHVRTLLIKECDNDFTYGSHWIPVNDSGPLDTRNSPGVQLLRCILTNLVNCKSCRFYSFGPDRTPQHYECGNMEPSNALYIILSIITEIALPITSSHMEFHYTRNVYAKQSQFQLCQQPGAPDRMEEHRGTLPRVSIYVRRSRLGSGPHFAHYKSEAAEIAPVIQKHQPVP